MNDLIESNRASPPHPRTVLVVTCTTSEAALAVKRELILLISKKIVHEDTICLTVEDPEKNVGSGGATLNALLVAVEHLSAKRGFNDLEMVQRKAARFDKDLLTVLNPDVLLDSRILIFHNGRPSFLEVCGNGFLSLPGGGHGVPAKTNLEHLLTIVQGLSRGAPESGVWVCSTDMLLAAKKGFDGPNLVAFPPADCVLFGALATPQYATGHGVLKLSSRTEGESAPWESVADISYCPPLDEVRALLREDAARVPVVCGLVYLSSVLSEVLLSLHAQTSIGCCTYLGTDSGAPPVQVSLFFDILTAMSEDVSKESFLAGDCGKTYGTAHSYAQNERTRRVRELVWTKLRRFEIGAIVLRDVDYSYLSERTTVASHAKLLREFQDPSRSGQPQLVNSVCEEGVASFAPGPSSVLVRHSLLTSADGRSIRLGTNSFLSGVVLDAHSEVKQLDVGDDVALLVFRSVGVDGATGSTAVVLGIHDDVAAPSANPSATFCNVGWPQFFERTGIAASDLWDPSTDESGRRLLDAKLFPVNGLVEDVLWFGRVKDRDEGWERRRDEWRAKDRTRLRDIVSGSRTKDEFLSRREASVAVAVGDIRRALSEDGEIALDPPFLRAAVEGWADRLLDVLDELAAGCDSEPRNPGKAARILGNVANLLGRLADGEGGLRSGPAANKEWTGAYRILERNSPGSIRDGVAALREARSKWRNLGPRWLIRAARHYEGAAQILIRHAVFTSERFVSVSPGRPLPPMDVWVTCECPARIDLFGGWTDTPPITYELGGSVVNASILVNGKRPIGAKIRRRAEPRILLGSDEGLEASLEEVGDLLDYDRPTSEGALAKACIAWTGIVRTDGNSSLGEQLAEKLGGSGFELRTWSDLPQGSGLGTSSIMAGAIVAVLWTVQGIAYDKNALVHGVLCVEQMLTTGGGWQDQVGGLTGGFVLGRTAKGLPLRVRTERLRLRPDFVERLERRLVLVYTGKIRLAKNLLQDVLRNWFARDAAMLDTFRNLGRKASDFVQALKEEDLPKIGQLMNEYWTLKKRLAPGAEPAAIASTMEALRPHSYGQLLCGAGGGGFMVVLLKDEDGRSVVDHIIASAEPSGVAKYSLAIDHRGISVRIGDETVAVD